MANLPINRGFDHHFGFLKGGQDHLTQREGNIVDLWEDHGPAYGRNGTFSTWLYGDEAVRIVQDHNTSAPLFLYLPFQVTHSPYEVPAQYLDPKISYKPRQTIAAMATVMDEAMGNLTKALESRDMLDDTLILFFADNGGVYHNGQLGNNYPLRGQKTSSWEGGVRVNAFVWGGKHVLPSHLRNTTHRGYIHVADWWVVSCFAVPSFHCMIQTVPFFYSYPRPFCFI